MLASRSSKHIEKIHHGKTLKKKKGNRKTNLYTDSYLKELWIVETEYTLNWFELENESYFEPDPSLVVHFYSPCTELKYSRSDSNVKIKATVLIDNF